MTLKQTPSQTVGPYFSYGLLPREYGYAHTTVVGNKLVADDALPGMRLEIYGRVFDGNEVPVIDALIEIWQPNHAGRFDHPDDSRDHLSLDANFHGFGRCGTDGDGRFSFYTIKPGSVGEGHAPFISVLVMMRGALNHHFSRIYFADEIQANANDTVLQQVPEARRHTIVREVKAGATGRLQFDIYMQGDNETVFFDV